ncbi:hypothetical protein LguiA_031362 [Lonicera macranthoides]
MASRISTPPPEILGRSATTNQRVSENRVRMAVKALLKWKKLQQSNNTQLFPEQEQDEDFIFLLLTLKKIPPKSLSNPLKIPLPHSLQSSLSELCLIIDDRQKSNSKSKITSDAAQKKIKSEDIPITKVLKLSKLKSDYKSFEAKRKLYDSYHMFFADRRVVPLLPKLLGKQFFKKKRKVPLPLDLLHINWKEQIERACSSALLCLSTGTCSVVRVGKVSMESSEIVENVIAAIDGVVEVVPKKWAGVRSFHLKFSESLALPIYQALPDMSLKIEGVKKTEGGTKEDMSKDENVGQKKGLKKGRIHDVQYMDAEDQDEGDGDNKSEDDDMGAAEVKKRRGGDLVMSGEKRAKKLGILKKDVLVVKAK